MSRDETAEVQGRRGAGAQHNAGAQECILRRAQDARGGEAIPQSAIANRQSAMPESLVPGPRPLLLSLCMIAKDEAENLSRCLSSVAGTVDETILVDTGSKDRTPEIAATHGARVVHRTWSDDFSAARNAALEYATGAWVLVLDADEELEVETQFQLRRLLAGADRDGFRLRIRNLHAEGDLCVFSESRVARLFRNRPEYRYQGVVHEQITPAILRSGGTVGDADLMIIHHGYTQRTTQRALDRAARNIRLLERALRAAPRDPYLHYQIGVTCKSLNEPERAEHHLREALRLGEVAMSREAKDVACMKLAQLTLAAGRRDDALDFAESSLRLNPQNTLSLYVAALASIERGDLRGAYDYFCHVRQKPDIRAERRRDVETVLETLRPLVIG